MKLAAHSTWYAISDVATIVGVPVPTLRHWIKRGKVPAPMHEIGLGSRFYYTHEQFLEACEETRKVVTK